jgi:hypothetical protein
MSVEVGDTVRTKSEAQVFYGASVSLSILPANSILKATDMESDTAWGDVFVFEVLESPDSSAVGLDFKAIADWVNGACEVIKEQDDTAASEPPCHCDLPAYHDTDCEYFLYRKSLRAQGLI